MCGIMVVSGRKAKANRSEKHALRMELANQQLSGAASRPRAKVRKGKDFKQMKSFSAMLFGITRERPIESHFGLRAFVFTPCSQKFLDPSLLHCVPPRTFARRFEMRVLFR